MDDNKEAIVILTGHYSSTSIFAILPNTEEYMTKAETMVEYLNRCYDPNDPDNDYARIEVYPFGQVFIPTNKYPYKVTIYRWTSSEPTCLSKTTLEWMKIHALNFVNNQNVKYHVVEAMDITDLEVNDLAKLEAELAGKKWDGEYDCCVIDGRTGKLVFRYKLTKEFIATSPETALNIAYDDLNTWCYENMADFKPYNWN